MRNSEQAHLEFCDLDSTTLGESVPISIIFPPNYPSLKAPIALLISLHGGGGSRLELDDNFTCYQQAFDQGILPSMVIVSFSSGPASMFAGKWEEFVVDELPRWMAQHYGTRSDCAGMALTGQSMGGYGALKISFRYPHRFCAVAVLEPAIEPSLTRMSNYLRNTWYRMPATEESVWGNPVDPVAWLADNPANIVNQNADEIRAAAMEIYLEAGDEDHINLHDGAEFMHRLLWDNNIRHEYHLVRWADHVGESLSRRRLEMLGFIGAACKGGRSVGKSLIVTAEEQSYVDWINDGSMARGEVPPIENPFANPERSPSLHARMWEKYRDLAKDDPEMQRAYAQLPSTKKP